MGMLECYITMSFNTNQDGHVGLHRRLNNVANSISAAKSAASKMTNLNSIELGNEPDCEKCSIFCFKCLY
jgi:hypothetical protein